MNLSGKLLIAMPGMGDPRFERSIVYLCAHSPEGAMGLVVNKPAPNITFPQLLKQLSIDVPSSDQIRVPLPQIHVLFGGPVETGRGFVLHSQDYYSEETTLPVTEDIGLTASVDVLRAIVRGDGPSHAILALGYSGWAPGQLEAEIQQNGWLHCDADDELLFGDNLEAKYPHAMAKLGIDLSALSGQAGHA